MEDIFDSLESDDNLENFFDEFDSETISPPPEQDNDLFMDITVNYENTQPTRVNKKALKEEKKRAKQQAKEEKRQVKLAKKSNRKGSNRNSTYQTNEEGLDWLNEPQYNPDTLQDDYMNNVVDDYEYIEQNYMTQDYVQDSYNKPVDKALAEEPIYQKNVDKESKSKSKLVNMVRANRAKQIPVKCTDPRFRKEDIHAQTTPYLDVDILYLSSDSNTLYKDELIHLREETYIPQEEESVPPSDIDFEMPILDSVDSDFDADQFLDGLEPLQEEINDSIDLPDFTDELPELQEYVQDTATDVIDDSINDFLDELPPIAQEMEVETPSDELSELTDLEHISENNVPSLQIKSIDDTVLDMPMDFGTLIEKETEKTSITFNKEALESMARRVN